MDHDLVSEGLLSLSAAARAVPTLDGTNPHPSTLWRWCRRGLNGCRLEYARIGQKIGTSEPALRRFFAAVAQADPVPASAVRTTSPRSRTDRQRERDIAAAEATCAKLGV